MATVKYKIHCNTENQDKFWLLPSDAAPPKKCPTNTAHEVDSSSVVVMAIGEETFKKNASGAVVVDGSSSTGFVGAQSISLNSHDWSDRTTWYQRSLRISNETLVDSGDGLTFGSVNPWWINMDSDRITYDYKTVPSRNGIFMDREDYRPVVKINDAATVLGTDYTVNYAAGTITLSGAKAAEIAQAAVPITVVCSYSHNNNVTRRSEWILCPPAGYAYLLDYIEMQFSKGVVFNPKGTCIEIWAGGNAAGVVPDVYGDFTKEEYDLGFGQNKSLYKGPKDFLNICTNRASQVIPAFSGLSQDTIIFPFDYLIQAQLKSSEGTVIMIALADDNPYTGAELATATFYMQLIPESALGA